MSKHTPGPWRVNDRDGNPRPTASGSFAFTIEAAKGRMFKYVADITVAYPVDEDLANARLIAAAPELLEALKGLVESPNDVPSDEQWKAAQAAIAKAEGNDA